MLTGYLTEKGARVIGFPWLEGAKVYFSPHNDGSGVVTVAKSVWLFQNQEYIGQGLSVGSNHNCSIYSTQV
jgi:hypothetical protein